MNWHEHFRYDETVPGCLVWIRFAANNRIKPGTPAGKYTPKQNKPDKGYFRVYVIDRGYAHHRIIWEMFNRPLESDEQVDHIDGNTQNNRIENLRVTNNQNNCYNQHRRVTNKSGTTGIHINNNGSGNLYWAASWMENGVRTGRNFSISKYGYEEARNMALAARQEAEERLKQQGIIISERHGKECSTQNLSQ